MTLFGEGQTVAQWARIVGPARQAVKTSRRISSVSLAGFGNCCTEGSFSKKGQ